MMSCVSGMQQYVKYRTYYYETYVIVRQSLGGYNVSNLNDDFQNSNDICTHADIEEVVVISTSTENVT